MGHTSREKCVELGRVFHRGSLNIISRYNIKSSDGSKNSYVVAKTCWRG